MSKLVEWLSTPWVGTVLAIISLAAAVFFYRKSKSVSRLAYQADEVTVVGGSTAAFPKELQIRFGGKAVPRVTATRAILWNAGNTTIRGDQIVDADALRFEVPEGNAILQASVVKRTRSTNGVILGSDDNSVRIEFDYLDPNDGAVIGIYHSAGIGEISCRGTLRGVPNGPLFLGPSSEGWGRRFRKNLPFNIPLKIFGVVLLGVGSLVLTYGVFYDSITKALPDTPIRMRWTYIGLGLLYMALPISMMWLARRRHPKGLEHTSLKAAKAPARQEVITEPHEDNQSS